MPSLFGKAGLVDDQHPGRVAQRADDPPAEVIARGVGLPGGAVAHPLEAAGVAVARVLGPQHPEGVQRMALGHSAPKGGTKEVARRVEQRRRPELGPVTPTGGARPRPHRPRQQTTNTMGKKL